MQGKLIAEQQAALQETVALVQSRELTPEWFTAERLRGEAEREAHRAANPAPPAPPWAGTYDPMAPARAWLAERAGETPALTTWGAAASGFDFAREYQATKAGMDAYTHAYAEGARQRDAMREQAVSPVAATATADGSNVVTPAVELPEIVVSAERPTPSGTASQIAAGFGGGVADAVSGAAQGAWELAKGIGRFATDSAFRQEVADDAARLAQLGLEMAAYAANDPRGAAQKVAEGAQSLYDQYQAAREQARRNGTLAEFDARFAGRLAAEGALAFLPASAIARAGKGAKLAAGAAKAGDDVASSLSAPAIPDGLAYRMDLPKH